MLDADDVLLTSLDQVSNGHLCTKIAAIALRVHHQPRHLASFLSTWPSAMYRNRSLIQLWTGPVVEGSGMVGMVFNGVASRHGLDGFYTMRGIRDTVIQTIFKPHSRLLILPRSVLDAWESWDWEFSDSSWVSDIWHFRALLAVWNLGPSSKRNFWSTLINLWLLVSVGFWWFLWCWVTSTQASTFATSFETFRVETMYASWDVSWSNSFNQVIHDMSAVYTGLMESPKSPSHGLHWIAMKYLHLRFFGAWLTGQSESILRHTQISFLPFCSTQSFLHLGLLGYATGMNLTRNVFPNRK